MLETYVVHVTKECNCDCKYCYETDKTSKYSWEEIKELLDNIVKYNKEFSIEFLGGEPLLAFNYIKQTYEYLENMDDVNVHSYCITTNGTILNDEIINFLKENKKVAWAASMDGTLFMNCLRITKDGYNTYHKVIENYKKLKKEIDENQITFHMVTHPYNIGYLSQGIDHFYNLGIRHIGVGTIESTIIIGKEYCERFISELDIVSQKIINNEYKDLSIDLFNNYKPRTDKRHYIYGKDGKVIGESYGRKENDIVSSNDVNAKFVSSNLGTLIEDIREVVYKNHQKRMRS